MTDRLVDYYERRAAGGVGLIIVEAASVIPIDHAKPLHTLSIDDDRFIPGLTVLAKALHKQGSRAVLQLSFNGGVENTEFPNVKSGAPSDKAIGMPDLCSSMTVREIKNVIRKFSEATARAIKAGFDGVELQGCHGSFIASFLSAVSNKRHDEYGGSLLNRCRLFVEILDAVGQVLEKNR